MCRPPGFDSCWVANRGLTATAMIVTASGLKSSTAKAAQPPRQRGISIVNSWWFYPSLTHIDVASFHTSTKRKRVSHWVFCYQMGQNE